MNEFEIIEKYFFSQDQAPGVVLGIGDDACVLETNSNRQLAVSVDTLVAGIHFPKEANAELIGQRALRVCLSDLAAMGAKARWFTLALTLPEVNENWLADFARGLNAVAEQYACKLVGGDTTKGPLTISIQVMGETEKGAAFYRSTASVGDLVYVSGTLGDAAAALALIKSELSFAIDPAKGDSIIADSLDTESKHYLLERYYKPEPRFREAGKLRGLATAAIDISDGLLADLGHICKQSEVGAEIDLAQIPYSEVVKKVADKGAQESWGLNGGDDYELCFTVSPEKCQLVDEMTVSGTLNVTAIGKITSGNRVHCFKQNKLIDIAPAGYQHFE